MNLTVRMNVRALLDDLPIRISQLPETLRAFGYPPITYKGVRRWYVQNSIPSDRLAAVLAVSDASGKRLDVNDYVEVEADANAAAA